MSFFIGGEDLATSRACFLFAAIIVHGKEDTITQHPQSVAVAVHCPFGITLGIFSRYTS